MTDEELRDLKERTSLVSEMSNHPGWELLRDRAVHELYLRQRRLIRGVAKDYEEYKAECAWMDGLSWVLELPGRLSTELEEALASLEQEEDEPEDEN